MARALDSMMKSKSFHIKKILESPGRQARSSAHEIDDEGAGDDKLQFKSQGSKTAGDRPLETHQVGFSVQQTSNSTQPTQSSDSSSRPSRPSMRSEGEQIKERFARLLLGEDMSGRGMGVPSSVALSNAITNLSASVFGEQGKLEPMSIERKTLWKKEIDLLLSVADHIVELVPSQQTNKDGTTMEVMVSRQRKDLLMNIPALRKLDAMLIEHLDNFKGPNEFWYVSRDEDDTANREDDKWWHPRPKVPPNGLSEASRKWLQNQKEAVNQVLKAAMAINAQLLSEMEIPDDYIESLPKNGRDSLGDSIYKSITVEFFDPGQLLSTMDLSTDHKVLEFKNKIEASIVIWKRKMNHKDGKSAWGSAVSLEKRELFEERAETILLLLKQRFPGLAQSQLESSKILFNRDVGQSILESYSRVLESVAYKVISRIEDVMYADSLAQNPSLAQAKKKSTADSAAFKEENLNDNSTSGSMTLSDFMGWGLLGEAEPGRSSSANSDELKEDTGMPAGKLHRVATHKKTNSFMDKLETLSGLKSPTPRH